MVPTAPTLGPNQSAAAAEIPLPEVTEGLLQIDGSTLEGWALNGPESVEARGLYMLLMRVTL